MNIQPTAAVVVQDEEEVEASEEVKKEAEELKEVLESSDVETTETDDVLTPEAELIVESIQQTEPTEEDLVASTEGEEN